MASFDENTPMLLKTLPSIDKQLKEFFPDDQPGHFTEADLEKISVLLQSSNRASYSRVPRLYTILRIINQLDVLDELIKRDITDISLPFDAKYLPSIINSEVQDKFLQHQHVVLTERLDLEKGEHGRHYHFGKKESAPYEVMGILGTGSSGRVEKVISRISSREYARKILERTGSGRKHRQHIKNFLTELRILKRIRHIHCVELIGSYTDHKFFALLMRPVADCDLGFYMTEAVNSVDKQSLLRTFFGCLCNGLQYLHQTQIRHRDIKPQNILVKGSSIFLTDFGISLDWKEMSRSTTTTNCGKSPMYCAPEVAHFEPRNSSSDIWSLGCVFLEMITVLKGQKISQMHDSFIADSNSCCFFANIRAINCWIENLYSLGSDRDNEPLKWIKLMLNVNLRDRPTAPTLFSIITNQHIDSDDSFNSRIFCGLCCVGDNESPPCSESGEECWIEEPEEQSYLDPALAQADQGSAPLESHTIQNQDLDHGSGNTGGVGFLSVIGIDHVEAAIVPQAFDCFPGCYNNENADDDNNRGGFSSQIYPVNHLQPGHKVHRRQNCTRGCDNNKGKGYLHLAKHIQSFHLSQKYKCTFPGCGNNGGKGFWDSSTLGNHTQSVHLGRTWKCPFPGCENNDGKGFSRPSLVKGHFRTAHLGQKFDCTFPGCDRIGVRGFSRSTLLRYHVRSAHSDSGAVRNHA